MFKERESDGLSGSLALVSHMIWRMVIVWSSENHNKYLTSLNTSLINRKNN